MAMPKNLPQIGTDCLLRLSRNMASSYSGHLEPKSLKTLATGANPEFAISNLPLDAMYAWFTSGQYSSVVAERHSDNTFVDYKRSIRDSITRLAHTLIM
jgi:hypothetical protein